MIYSNGAATTVSNKERIGGFDLGSRDTADDVRHCPCPIRYKFMCHQKLPRIIKASEEQTREIESRSFILQGMRVSRYAIPIFRDSQRSCNQIRSLESTGQLGISMPFATLKSWW